MQPYDVSTRIPLYIRGPRISEGSTSNKLVGNIDFLPTFLDLAGIDYNENDYDGRSFRNILENGDGFSDEWRSIYLIEFKSVGSFGFTHCPIWWPASDGSLVPGEVIKPSRSLTGNQVDNTDTNNWRVLRILNGTNNLCYCEF